MGGYLLLQSSRRPEPRGSKYREEKMPLKDVSETGEGSSGLDNHLNMGCEGDISCMGGSETVPRFLLWDPRLIANTFIKV